MAGYQVRLLREHGYTWNNLYTNKDVIYNGRVLGTTDVNGEIEHIQINGFRRVKVWKNEKDNVLYIAKMHSDGTEHARRKTVTALDVVYALKRQGRTMYGFGG